MFFIGLVHDICRVSSLSPSESLEVLNHLDTTTGSYILRHSRSHGRKYCLDVFYIDSVKRIHINFNEVGELYLAGQNKSFPSLEVLIEYYHRNYIGSTIHCKLTTCCSGMTPTSLSVVQEKDELEVASSELKFKSILYNGSRHKVWHGCWNGTLVTIKVAKETTLPRFSLLEIKTMKRLRHPNIVQLYAVCTVSDSITLVLEHLRKPLRLSDYLQKLKQQPSLKFIIQVASQVARAMEYLAKLNITHCHLKSSSIQLVGQQQVKVTNFYHSRVLQDGSAHVPYGNWRWKAPEVNEYKLVTNKSDVWSFGVLLHQMFTRGKQLYEGTNPEDIASILRDEYRLPCPSGCEKAWYEIMIDCWRWDGDERPEFSHLLVRIQELQTLGECVL